MNTGVKIIITLTSIGVIATGGYFLYKYVSKDEEQITENQFALLVQTAHNIGSDIFKGMSTVKLDSIYNKAKVSITSSEITKLINLLKRGEKNWLKKEKDEFLQIFSKMK